MFEHDHIGRATPFTAEEGVPGLRLEAEVTILAKTYMYAIQYICKSVRHIERHSVRMHMRI